MFYGAAEFSRDTDFALHAAAENLERLGVALRELQASVTAVRALSLEHLQLGHAVRFRCQNPQAERLRVDGMLKPPGVDDFPRLWGRRTTLQGEDGTIYGLMSLRISFSRRRPNATRTGR